MMHSTKEQWTYYRCDQPLAAVSAFYQQSLPSSYGWYEDNIQEYQGGILLVYNNSPVSSVSYYRWLYLWLFPEESNSQVSDLVAVWFDKVGTC